MHRHGMGNKILIAIVLLLALAAVLGFILTATQGDALDAITGSTDETEDKLDDEEESLSDDILGRSGGSPFGSLTGTGGANPGSGLLP